MTCWFHYWKNSTCFVWLCSWPWGYWCENEWICSIHNSTMQPCMEYCCHVWTGASNCYLDMLDKLQKRFCKTVDSSFAASLKTLAQRWNKASFSLLYRYYFNADMNWLNRPHCLISSNRLHDFSVSTSICSKDVYVNSVVRLAAR